MCIRDRTWDEVKRFENPHRYYVDLSQALYTLKSSMLDESEAKIRAMIEQAKEQ